MVRCLVLRRVLVSEIVTEEDLVVGIREGRRIRVVIKSIISTGVVVGDLLWTLVALRADGKSGYKGVRFRIVGWIEPRLI